RETGQRGRGAPSRTEGGERIRTVEGNAVEDVRYHPGRSRGGDAGDVTRLGIARAHPLEVELVIGRGAVLPGRREVAEVDIRRNHLRHVGGQPRAARRTRPHLPDGDRQGYRGEAERDPSPRKVARGLWQRERDGCGAAEILAKGFVSRGTRGFGRRHSDRG